MNCFLWIGVGFALIFAIYYIFCPSTLSNIFKWLCTKIKSIWDEFRKFPCWKKLLVIIVIIVILFILVFFVCWLKSCPSPTTLEPIKLKENEVENAQKEMEILSQFLISNGTQIIMIRQVLIIILIGIAGYVLKEQLIHNNNCSKGIDFSHLVPHILLFMLIIIFFAFFLEAIIQVIQTALTNRIFQLDRAINCEILEPCPNKLQDIFASKEKFDITPCGIANALWMIFYSPTHIIFYVLSIFFIILFGLSLKKIMPKKI